MDTLYIVAFGHTCIGLSWTNVTMYNIFILYCLYSPTQFSSASVSLLENPFIKTLLENFLGKIFNCSIRQK